MPPANQRRGRGAVATVTRKTRPPSAAALARYTARPSSNTDPLDPVQVPGLSGPCMIQIPAQLKIHPEVGCCAEILGQAQRGRGGDATPSIDQLIDPLIGNPDAIREIALGEPHRIQKLFQQHLARM